VSQYGREDLLIPVDRDVIGNGLSTQGDAASIGRQRGGRGGRRS
jgi:hypothetical protein